MRDRGYVACMSDFTVTALSPETFADFAALVERNKGMFASCWCTHFHPDCAEKGQTAEGNRALKQRLVDEGVAHAALVYDGGRAVAWAQFGTPEELPNIQHRKEYLATSERLPDYRVTCIQVERDHRGQGLAAVALRGAVELIARAGVASSRATRTTPVGSARRTRRSSTTAPARCTSARVSPTTGPRGWATA